MGLIRDLFRSQQHDDGLVSVEYDLVDLNGPQDGARATSGQPAYLMIPIGDPETVEQIEALQSRVQRQFGTARLPDDPHVTIRYGVRSTAEESIQALRGHGAVTVRLGSLAVFRNPTETIVVLLVQGDQLASLRSLVESSLKVDQAMFPVFRPHVTIAYLPADVPHDAIETCIERLWERYKLEGRQFSVDSCLYGRKGERPWRFSLTGDLAIVQKRVLTPEPERAGDWEELQKGMQDVEIDQTGDLVGVGITDRTGDLVAVVQKSADGPLEIVSNLGSGGLAAIMLSESVEKAITARFGAEPYEILLDRVAKLLSADHSTLIAPSADPASVGRENCPHCGSEHVIAPLQASEPAMTSSGRLCGKCGREWSLDESGKRTTE